MKENNNYVRRTFVLDLINAVYIFGGFKSYDPELLGGEEDDQ